MYLNLASSARSTVSFPWLSCTASSEQEEFSTQGIIWLDLVDPFLPVLGFHDTVQVHVQPEHYVEWAGIHKS